MERFFMTVFVVHFNNFFIFEFQMQVNLFEISLLEGPFMSS